jgi:hypothetical protein
VPTRSPTDEALDAVAALLRGYKLYEHSAALERCKGDYRAPLETALPAVAYASRSLRLAEAPGDPATREADLRRALGLDLLAVVVAWLLSARARAYDGFPEDAERQVARVGALLRALPQLLGTPAAAVELPWSWGSPSLEAVAAHAAAHPIPGRPGFALWLCARDATWGTEVALLDLGAYEGAVVAPGLGEEYGTDQLPRGAFSRFLPTSAEGIPLCFLLPAAAVDVEGRPVEHVPTEDALEAIRSVERVLEPAALEDATVRKALTSFRMLAFERDHHAQRVGQLLQSSSQAVLRFRALAHLVGELACTDCDWRGPAREARLDEGGLACPTCGVSVGVPLTPAPEAPEPRSES